MEALQIFSPQRRKDAKRFLALRPSFFTVLWGRRKMGIVYAGRRNAFIILAPWLLNVFKKTSRLCAFAVNFVG